jgi:hypothetical protein
MSRCRGTVSAGVTGFVSGVIGTPGAADQENRRA